MTTACRALICDCRTVLDAKARYEDATARLRHQTTAAWVRWEDMPIDGRLSWVKGPHTRTDHCANPGACWVHGLTDEVIAEEIRNSHQQLTNGGTNQ